ncbi:MAG: hypothetical protein ACYTFY_16150, partial [Planctomycetota bacterium]
ERYGQLLHDNAKRSQADADEAAAKDYAEKAENAFNLALQKGAAGSTKRRCNTALEKLFE